MCEDQILSCWVIWPGSCSLQLTPKLQYWYLNNNNVQQVHASTLRITFFIDGHSTWLSSGFKQFISFSVSHCFIQWLSTCRAMYRFVSCFLQARCISLGWFCICQWWEGTAMVAKVVLFELCPTGVHVPCWRFMHINLGKVLLKVK